MTEKDFASMPINELKAYHDSLSEKITKVERRLREIVLNEGTEKDSLGITDDYLTVEISEEQLKKMGKASLKRYRTHLMQEREMAGWFLRNRCKH